MENLEEKQNPIEGIRIGSIYKHFKGNEYLVEKIVTDSETLEPIVIYQALYGEHKVWARPAKMFLEEVDKPEMNYKGPRFSYVREN